MENLAELNLRIARTMGLGSNSTPLPPNPSKRLVLVVDDEAVNRRYLSLLLKTIDLEFAEAGDGMEACSLVEAARPDAILLDVMLPGIDGFEVCRRIKSAPKTVNIPVLMISGLRHPEMIHRGIAAGADGFISKPLDSRDVALRLRNALRTNQPLVEGLNAPGVPETLGDFVSRQMCDPLKSIAGTLSRLRDCGGIPEQLREDTHHAAEAAETIASLNEGVWEIEGLREAIASHGRRTVDLRSLVTEALRIQRDPAGVRNGIDQAVEVICQPEVTVRALTKLIEYAVQRRGEAGGMISISAETEGARVVVRIRMGGASFRHVTDLPDPDANSGNPHLSKDAADVISARLVFGFCIAVFGAQGGEVGGCGSSLFFTLPSVNCLERDA